jgi:hypothetical protein
MHRRTWSWLLSGLVVALVFAGCGSVSSNADGGGGAGGGMGGTTGTGGGGGTTGSCAFASTYTIRDGGGLAPTADTATLTPPSSFRFERMFFGADAGRLSCEPALPACDDPARVDVRDVEAAIAHADVQTALAAATPPTYGNRAVADGPNFNFMRADGRGFNAGLACDTPSTTCTPIPPGVNALVTLLRDLIRQQRMDPTCSAITN